MKDAYAVAKFILAMVFYDEHAAFAFERRARCEQRDDRRIVHSIGRIEKGYIVLNALARFSASQEIYRVTWNDFGLCFRDSAALKVRPYKAAHFS